MKTFSAVIASLALLAASPSHAGLSPLQGAGDFCDTFMETSWDYCVNWEESGYINQSYCAGETYASACPERFEGGSPLIPDRNYSWYRGNICRTYGTAIDQFFYCF